MSDLRNRIASLTPEQRELLEDRLRQQQAAASKQPAIVPVTTDGPMPLSFGQERLWFLDLLYPGAATYNEPSAYRLHGNLDREALAYAFTALVARHEILRTTYSEHDGMPYQAVAPATSMALPFYDLRVLSPRAKQSEWQKLAAEIARQPFDLTKDLALRAALFQLDDEDYRLLLVEHHIATDATSLRILLRELSVLYGQAVTGTDASLPPLEIHYKDFAAWQRKELTSESLAEERAYWRKQLAELETLDLPTDRPRPATPSHAGGVADFVIDPELSESLAEIAEEEKATVFMVLLTALAVLLYRYTRQEDIVIGMPVAGRNVEGVQDMVGFFVNTLVLRTDLSGDPSFRELLRLVRARVSEALQYQNYPYENLVADLQPKRQIGQNPLFEVIMQVNAESESALSLPGIQTDSVELDFGVAKFDLDISFFTGHLEWRSRWVYNAELFDLATVDRMIGHFQQLLQNSADYPDSPVSRLRMITEAEEAQFEIWNATAVDYPREQTIHDLFRRQAEMTPDAPAVFFEGDVLSYSELDRRSNQLAHYLRELNVEPGELVGLALDRSIEMIIAMLAILKASAAYVPLDTEYPDARIQHMLSETRCRHIVTSKLLLKSLPEYKGQTVVIDTVPVEEALKVQPVAVPPTIVKQGSASVAYVMFTSGSTGVPKGTVIPHRAVVRLVKSTNYAQMDAGQRFLQFAPISFDASTLEIWGPLLNGGQLFVYAPGRASLAELARYLTEHKITFLWLTSGLFHRMVDHELLALGRVAQVFSGGDIVSPAHVRHLIQESDEVQFSNGYGPTENTTFTTTYRVTNADQIRDNLPIGKPIANSQVYILDQFLQRVPVGVPGELYAGGDGLALGYLNQPELTAEKFLPNPFSTEPMSRIYRTGDLARYLPDGNIAFLGRLDSQVKIRGYRIELGEIESCLLDLPTVEKAIVVAKTHPTLGKQLIAYVIPANGTTLEVNDLRAKLVEQLPQYMIPSSFVLMDQFPLDPNGKINRRALPEPNFEAARGPGQLSEPQSADEAAIAAIWQRVLGLTEIDVEQDFFDAGGHSLLGVQLFALIEKELGWHLSPNLLYQAPTIRQLALAAHEEAITPSDPILVPVQGKGTRSPFFYAHGVYGDLSSLTNVARYLDKEQPVYGLQAIGLSEGQEPDHTIEAMARRYIDKMRQLQPSGPYMVGGFCFGGVVAYEIACQLREEGEDVSLLAIIEGSAPSALHEGKPIYNAKRLEILRHTLPHWLGGYGEFGGWRIRERIQSRWKQSTSKGQLEQAPFHLHAEFDNLTDFNKARPDIQYYLEEIHKKALSQYKPLIYEGSITFIRARYLRVSDALSPSLDPLRGWGKLAGGGVTTYFASGTHGGILKADYAAELATLLNTIMSQNSESATAYDGESRHS